MRWVKAKTDLRRGLPGKLGFAQTSLWRTYLEKRRGRIVKL